MNTLTLRCFSKEELIEKILDLDKNQKELLIVVNNQITLIHDLGIKNEVLIKENELLRNQNGILKKTPQKPVLKPNKLENSSSDEKEPIAKKKWSKTSKKLTPTEIIILQPTVSVPATAIFKGYKTYLVQEVEFKIRVIEYRIARYEIEDGKILQAQLPKEIEGSHFGPELIKYIIYQNQKLRVPQGKILEDLIDKGIQISEGQINNILANSVELFKAEQQDIFQAGLTTAQYLQADDTGAIHKNKNGVSTYIGNELFSYFVTTDSKSRLNLLNILSQNKDEYVVNDVTRSYMATKSKNHSKLIEAFLTKYKDQKFTGQDAWQKILTDFVFSDKCITRGHMKSLTEGALYGYLFSQGLGHLVFLSDGAPQFKIFKHALCWVHIIRSINNLIPKTESEQIEYKAAMSIIQDYYAKLKTYKIKPHEDFKQELLAEFDQIFYKTNYNFSELQDGMININKYKNSLLLVLDYPFLPLHNNGSEREVREHVIKRKISGGTRSDTGRDVRDVFTTLSKTCQKHKISFWSFLSDRLHHTAEIPNLGNLIIQKAASMQPPPRL